MASGLQSKSPTFKSNPNPGKLRFSFWENSFAKKSHKESEPKLTESTMHSPAISSVSSASRQPAKSAPLSPASVPREPYFDRNLSVEPSLDRQHSGSSKRVPPNLPPEFQHSTSISARRDRSFTAILFEGISGQRLKCYQQWKLWLGLFVCMTMVAVVALSFAGYFAVQVHAYKSKAEALDAQFNVIYGVINDVTSNISDHTSETQKIFNTFDDNADGGLDADEYYEYFVLGGSVKTVFDSADADGDDILSWKEIATSISRYDLSQSYQGSVHEMYNLSFAVNSSEHYHDPLLDSYAANVYLKTYGIAEFGYLSRSHYYQFRANKSYRSVDIDEDNSIDLNEFVRHIANDRMISFFRGWDIDSYLDILDEDGVESGYNLPNMRGGDDEPTNMCPYNVDSCGSSRRRIIDQSDITFVSQELEYNHYVNWNDGGTAKTCTAQLKCEKPGGETAQSSCDTQDIDQAVQCMVEVINKYLVYENRMICHQEIQNCHTTYPVWSASCDNLLCTCECSEGCRGYRCPTCAETPSPVAGRRRLPGGDRRRLASCSGPNCACGNKCECFSGDNAMWMKRHDVIQNILLKDLRIGDYALAKDGEWSKVWFIKEQRESEHEFVELYYGNDEYVTMTTHHLLYVGAMSAMKRADDVAIGDIVFVMDASNNVFVEREIVAIEYSASLHGAYAPVTMDGSIVVNNVLSSCYVESPEKAQRLHDTAAVFRWISRYNTELASAMTHLFYDNLFMKLRTTYGLDGAHIVFNAYSMPCILIASVTIASAPFIRSFYSFF